MQVNSKPRLLARDELFLRHKTALVTLNNSSTKNQ